MGKLAIFIILFSASMVAHAQYKCIAPDGVLEYRSTPCPGSPEAKMRAAQRETQPAAPTGPNYWQREAARLERKEAAERAENEAWGREQRAIAQAEADRITAAKQAAADKAERDRPIICRTKGIAIGVGSNVAVTRSKSVCRPGEEEVLPAR